jgi:tripartite-type tricarboxylate transporter receptor subunit TctC
MRGAGYGRGRPGAELSDEADPAGVALRARRHHRLCRPDLGAKAHGEYRPAGRRGEQARRRWYSGHGYSRAVDARWLHAGADGPAIVINPTLQSDVPYDLFKNLQTVSIVSSSPEVLVVSPKLPVNTFSELVAYGKANPGKLNFASAGIGTTPHLAGEMFKLRTGIDATHVPYKGIGSSYTDMMSGKVQMAFSSIAGALPFTSDNRVKPLATTGVKRSLVYPDLPTVAEGGLPGFEVDLWLGVFAPASLPAPVLARLNGELKKALESADLKASLAKVGVEPRGTSPEEGAGFLRAEFDKWKQVITDGKIKEN